MTEQQPYTVLRASDDYELREYPACTVAEIIVEADFDKAGSMAFQPLFTYISGNNLGQISIDMTAPVVQQESGELEPRASTGRSEQLSMTAPVLQSSDVAGRQAVAFVMLSSVTAAPAPTPVDSRVVNREMPPSLTAATRYSGRCRVLPTTITCSGCGPPSSETAFAPLASRVSHVSTRP